MNSLIAWPFFLVWGYTMSLTSPVRHPFALLVAMQAFLFATEAGSAILAYDLDVSGAAGRHFFTTSEIVIPKGSDVDALRFSLVDSESSTVAVSTLVIGGTFLGFGRQPGSEDNYGGNRTYSFFDSDGNLVRSSSTVRNIASFSGSFSVLAPTVPFSSFEIGFAPTLVDVGLNPFPGAFRPTVGVNLSLTDTTTVEAVDGEPLTPVPLPAAGWMLLAAVCGLGAVKRRGTAIRS